MSPDPVGPGSWYSLVRGSAQVFERSCYWTVTVTEVDAVEDPLVPFTVIVKVVAEALRVALIFMVVAAPLDVGVTGFGVKLAETFFSKPEADIVTGAAVPLVSFTVIVSVVLFPLLTVIDEELALTVKTGGGAVTVSETVVVCVTPPPIPVMVMV
jgi:hypothetical protein